MELMGDKGRENASEGDTLEEAWKQHIDKASQAKLDVVAHGDMLGHPHLKPLMDELSYGVQIVQSKLLACFRQCAMWGFVWRVFLIAVTSPKTS